MIEGVYFACVSMAAGVIGGALSEPLFLVREAFRGKGKLLFDLLSVMVILFPYLFLATFAHFPDFRYYFWLFSLFGGLIYRKSIHRIVAFLAKRLYNKKKRKG
ncbi:MAG: hypothetical protein J6D37_02990 [Clostridia bacterium]|nr:hypothetical protein [Clostridia bacterium]